MSVRRELGLRLPNSPGSLASVCRLLGDERVRIVAMSLEAGGQLRLVVDNPLRAKTVLEGAHHRVTERDVIVSSVPQEPGGATAALTLLADAAINVEYAYAGTESNAAALIVVGVEDAMRAADRAGV